MENKRLKLQLHQMTSKDLEFLYKNTKLKSEADCQKNKYLSCIQRYIKEHPEENLSELLDGCKTIEDYVNKYPLKQDEFTGNWRNDI